MDKQIVVHACNEILTQHLKCMNSDTNSMYRSQLCRMKENRKKCTQYMLPLILNSRHCKVASDRKMYQSLSR